MQKSFSQNNLLGGLSVDRDLVSSQPNTLADAINATISPEDGSKLVYQSVKSMVPETSIYQHLYRDNDSAEKSHVIEVIQQQVLTSHEPREITFSTVKMKEAFFVFTASGFDVDSLKGKSNFFLQYSIKYKDSTAFSPQETLLLQFMEPGDYQALEVDPDQYVDTLRYQVFGPGINGYEAGLIEYFDQAPANAKNNVGPDQNKIILGTRTFNNVTYFVVGSPDFKTTPRLFKNNVGVLPAHHWNNTTVQDEKFKPEFYNPSGSINSDEVERDRLIYTSNVVTTRPLNLKYTYFGSWGSRADFLGSNQVKSSIERKQVGDALQADGHYTFSITATLNADLNIKSWQHILLAARLVVERPGGTYSSYPNRSFSFMDNLGWDLGEKRYREANISRNTIVTLTDLKKGDRVFLEMAGESRSKGRASFILEGGVSSSTTFLVNSPSSSSVETEIYRGLETLLEKMTVKSNASSNLHFNGKIEFSVNTSVLDENRYSAVPQDIPSFYERNSVITPSTLTLAWNPSQDENTTSYEVQCVISTNKLHQVSVDSEWMYLGKTTNKSSFEVSVLSLVSLINKSRMTSTYYVWFRIAPRSGVRGNWSGGYYRFSFSRQLTQKDYTFSVEPIGPSSLYVVDPAAKNPETGSWLSGSLSSNSDEYEYALDYNDFRKVAPDGTGAVHGICPGIHTLYLRRNTSGKSVYAKKSFTIGCERLFEDLELTTSIIMSGNTPDISNFTVRVKVHDPSNDFGLYKIYISPYKNLDTENLDPSCLYGTILSDTETDFNVTQKMSRTGNLYVYATASGYRDVLDQDGLVFLSEMQVESSREENKYYKRVAKATLMVSDDLSQEKYNLELGSFPSPFYGHSRGKLINLYQPLQNLDSRAFITNEIKLSGNSYVEMEIQPVYDGSVNIIFTDGEKMPRSINSGFSVLADNRFEIITQNNSKNTNRYFTESVEVSTRLVQTESSVASVGISSVNSSGGHLEVGSYKLLFKLATSDGNETDFVAETGLIPIFFGDTLGSIQGGATGTFTRKSIDLTLKNVDSCFSHVSLYVHHATGVNQLVRSFYKVDFQYLIQDQGSPGKTTDVNITFTGLEPVIKMDMEKLNEQHMPLSSVKTLAQAQNRLFVANFTHEDIDYNSLLKVGTSILVSPCMGNEAAPLSDLMENWPSENSGGDLQSFSSNFLDQKLGSFDFSDMNTEDAKQMEQMVSASRSQGYHNPLFVEKYAAYWPKETYSFGVSFISRDNFVTRPVPVVGADYIDLDYSTQKDKAAMEIFASSKEEIAGVSDGRWKDYREAGISFNTIGVCRFPRQEKPNQVFFPKFTFDLNDFNDHYPGFFSKFKGFFFTRAERRPDIIMQGFIGPVLATLTDKTVIQDMDPLKYVPSKSSTTQISLPSETVVSDALKACVPSLYSGLGILGFEYSQSSTGDDINWGILKEGHAGAFIADMLNGNALEKTYKENYAYNPYYGKVPVFKKWFRSGDMFADFVQASTDFNGKTYGIQMVAGIDSGTYEQYSVKTAVSQYHGDITSGDTQMRDEHVLQALKPSRTRILVKKEGDSENANTYKITPDFRPYGSNSRSPGGFSSLIPFRSLGRKFLDSSDHPIITFLTGVFTAYVGISSKTDLPHGFYDVYPGTEGPIKRDDLKIIYSVNSNDQHIAVTPRYLFDSYLGKRSVQVYATRGDCFVTTTVHNIARSLPAVSGNPSSNSTMFTAQKEGSNEPNSYRGSSASMSVMATHASNHLGYARHTEVTDERESASYGGPRSFLPLSGTIDKIIGISHGAKQPETTAFNKGYADNFLGKKFYSVSGTSPYYARKGSNTVAFSGLMTRDSFFNAFREFDLGASRTYGSEMGSVCRMIEFRNNLVAAHSNGVYLIGINDHQLLSQENEQAVYAGSVNVLSEKPVPLSSKLGTRYPRSVEKSDRFVYGVDAGRGKIWRTDGQTFEVISDNVVESLLKGFLYQMQGLDEIPGERYIASFYDPSKREMIFSIYNRHSQHPGFSLPMNPDIYFFLKNLHSSGMVLSGNNTQKAADLLYHWAGEGWYSAGHRMNSLAREDRMRYVELFLKIYSQISGEMDSRVNNCLTLVYSEDMGIWVTRWSVAPEFMFHHNGITYSIANKQDTEDLPSNLLNFIQDIEARLVAGNPGQSYSRVNTPVYHPSDHLRRIIWRHEGFNPSIPMYGSFYGKAPVFELSVVVAAEPTREKTFENISIVGSHSTPSVVIYTMSDDNPLLNHVMASPEYKNYTSWDNVQDAYFDHFGSYSKKQTIYPAMFFKQYVRDRRHNSISRSNAFYSQGRMEIAMSKGIQPMFISSQDLWERIKFRYFQDKYIKICLRYESGEEVRVHTLMTTFSY